MSNHNPPAYPSTNAVRFGEFATSGHPGMTLLDHLAGLAMQALITSGKKDVDATCSESFRFANTMLKEREKWIK